MHHFVQQKRKAETFKELLESVDEAAIKSAISLEKDTLATQRNKLEKMLKREQRWSLATSCFSCIPVMAELDRLKYTQIFDH